MKKTIIKALEELKKEAPDLSYVRGMLEVLVDNDEPVVMGPQSSVRKLTVVSQGTNEEEIVPAALRIGPVGDLNS